MNRSAAGKAYTELVLATLRLNSELISAGDALTKDLGLSSARWQIFGQIARTPDPLTVSQLARDMGVQRQNVQPQVDLLVADGLVDLIENPNHRRAKLVRMSTAGQRAYREADRRQVVWSNRVARGLSVDELKVANELLREILHRLQTAAKKSTGTSRS